MKENSQQNSVIKKEDYLVATLLDFFRSPKAAHDFIHAARLALTVLARDSSYSEARLEKRFIFFASKLKGNINIKSLRDFAEECYVAAIKTGAYKEEPKGAELSLRTLKKHAKEDLSVSLRLGHSEGAAVNRAAYELIKRQQEEKKKARMRASIQSHPLRETLSGLMVKENLLAKEDIRNQFLRLKRSPNKYAGEGMLFSLLEKAQAFSAARVHRLLGDELFFLCRPTGFLDQKGNTVVVEVPTTAHLHALTYRKLEIIKALKAENAFFSVNKVHLKIS